MPVVHLGNQAALDGGKSIPGDQVTTATLPDSATFDEWMRSVAHVDGLWRAHSAAPPTWVESDDEELAAALAEHFNCPIGRPEVS